jgi:hypothetical protein
MRRIECEFEADVLAAAVQSRWPERVDAELRAHVSTCEICSDVAAVAVVMDEASVQLRASAVVPEGGRVWWLAQVRARREAAAAAGRPITAIQVVACACAAGLFGACFGATSTWFQSALRSAVHAKSVLAGHEMLAAGVAAVLLLAPVAVYLAEGRD